MTRLHHAPPSAADIYQTHRQSPKAIPRPAGACGRRPSRRPQPATPPAAGAAPRAPGGLAATTCVYVYPSDLLSIMGKRGRHSSQQLCRAALRRTAAGPHGRRCRQAAVLLSHAADKRPNPHHYRPSSGVPSCSNYMQCMCGQCVPAPSPDIPAGRSISPAAAPRTAPRTSTQQGSCTSRAKLETAGAAARDRLRVSCG